MDLVVLQKIEPSILNGLGYISRLEKKNGSRISRNENGLIPRGLEVKLHSIN